jgi:hypothetical protein
MIVVFRVGWFSVSIDDPADRSPFAVRGVGHGPQPIETDWRRTSHASAKGAIPYARQSSEDLGLGVFASASDGN